MTLLEFRRNLEWDLINNPEIVVKEGPMRRSKRHQDEVSEHVMLTAPRYAKFWDGTKWNLASKKAYQQYT
jgi:hypothetical protein